VLAIVASATAAPIQGIERASRRDARMLAQRVARLVMLMRRVVQGVFR
jgi:hypothetical protein